MIEEQIEKLKTLQESYDIIADTVESQLPALADKIDNIQLPEIDTTELAKQGSNQEATNSKILDEVKDVKNTFDALDIPLSAISGLALELEGGKKNIANALKARGVESSANTDTLTDMAAKVYDIKNPVAFTVPAETSNKVADDFFNTMMKSQGYDQIYESVYETYCGEGGSYVGCLMTDLSKSKNTSIQLIGADAYYIYEEDIFYKTGEDGKLIQFLNGSEVQLATDKHVWDADIANPCRIVFYLYLPNSTANGQRENVHASNIDYCRNSSIPYIKYSSNGGRFMYFHLSNPESCVLSYSGTANNTRTIFFYSNVETCSATMALTGNQDYMYFLHLESLKSITAGTVVNSTKLRHIEFPDLEEITGGSFMKANENIDKIYLPKVKKITSATLYNDTRARKLEIDLPSIETLERQDSFIFSGSNNHLIFRLKSGVNIRQLISGGNVVEFICSEIYTTFNNGNLQNNPNGAADIKAKKIYFHDLKKANIHLGGSSGWTNNVEYIYVNCIGDRTDHIFFNYYYNTVNSLAICTKIEISEGARQILTFKTFPNLTAENITEFIFERLADNRFEDDGVTPAPAIKITLGSVNLAKLTDAQKAIATDKNYILA